MKIAALPYYYVASCLLILVPFVAHVHANFQFMTLKIPLFFVSIICPPATDHDIVTYVFSPLPINYVVKSFLMLLLKS
jgi:uncharacterized membrane protein